jgi:hypothetical protein
LQSFLIEVGIGGGVRIPISAVNQDAAVSQARAIAVSHGDVACLIDPTTKRLIACVEAGEHGELPRITEAQ